MQKTDVKNTATTTTTLPMTVTAVLLASVLIVAVVSIVPSSANADSINHHPFQTAEKFYSRCDKAQEKESQKKADQAGDQAVHHGEKLGGVQADCNV